jgi:type II secretory pathway pseudopilin PulG
MLELMVVVVVMGLVTITAIPALSLIHGARRVGVVQEIERALLLARARAMATGQPHGVRFEDDRVSLVMIPAAGDSPEVAVGFDASPVLDTDYAFTLNEQAITQLQTGTGGSGDFIAWFSIDGTPELRSSTGQRLGAWTSDMVVTVVGGHVITVRQRSGAVQRS